MIMSPKNRLMVTYSRSTRKEVLVLLGLVVRVVRPTVQGLVLRTRPVEVEGRLRVVWL